MMTVGSPMRMGLTRPIANPVFSSSNEEIEVNSTQMQGSHFAVARGIFQNRNSYMRRENFPHKS
jgi:hypothetical protein